MKKLINEVKRMQQIAGLIKESKESIKTYTFGYDLSNIEEVEEYLRAKYNVLDSQEVAEKSNKGEDLSGLQAEMIIGYGDDTMNGLEIYDPALLKDQELQGLINACEGEGDFDEEDYNDEEDEEDEDY